MRHTDSAASAATAARALHLSEKALGRSPQRSKIDGAGSVRPHALTYEAKNP